MQQSNRLRELDFLRGIAIILVIARHQMLFPFLKTMGWIGVDLFFVLSGFLVSGLLFKEYQSYGQVNPRLFLIRRGFKIYPIFYLTYIGYMLPKILLHKLELKKVLFEIFFIQNYALGWGYTYAASWSLAVEEHFYFGLALLIWYITSKKKAWITNIDENKRFSILEKLLLSMLAIVFLLRIISNVLFPEHDVKNMTMTHLRIDSLLAGVLISYWYYFKNEKLSLLFLKYQKYLVTISCFFLSFTPFVEPVPSFFVKTFGFSMLYIAFGIVLIKFLVDKEINKKMNAIFSITLVNYISKIGFCSYSIYIIHSFVIYVVGFLALKNHYLSFVLTFVFSTICGFVMTYNFEKYFLMYRDKYFPSSSI